MSARRFARAGRLRKGYSRRQVDSFLTSVEAALSGAARLPSAAQVRAAGFELVRGGYQVVAVDAALDELEQRVLVARAMAGADSVAAGDPVAERVSLLRDLASSYGQRFPRVRRLRRGYDPGYVDALLDRVTAALKGNGGITAEEVRRSAFPPRWGGYDDRAVDAALDRVVDLMQVDRRPSGPERTEAAQP